MYLGEKNMPNAPSLPVFSLSGPTSFRL